ncbi:MAG TPA: hypothetical protein VHX39_13375, partial [Acetobacteraceae bacterium]|nr:hypothetical protein [Acetobacteraceae bacterium]
SGPQSPAVSARSFVTQKQPILNHSVPETLGLTLDEGKQMVAATQAEIVRGQVRTMGERFR